MNSLTQRCAVCGRVLARVGRAKRYVHADQFHVRMGHQPVPARAAIAPRAVPAPVARVIDLRDAERVSA